MHQEATAPVCCISTAIWFTKSPAPRRSKGSPFTDASPGASAQPRRGGSQRATTAREQGIADPISRLQVDTLDENCEKYGITEFRMNDRRQGIVHIIGPEQGATLPGMTVVCGDSHTSTHGALGALAFGIGTSEVEHVLATQTLLMKKNKNMLIRVEGALPTGCTAKDVVLHIIGKIGTAGGTATPSSSGQAPFAICPSRGRMTVCNMRSKPRPLGHGCGRPENH